MGLISSLPKLEITLTSSTTDLERGLEDAHEAIPKSLRKLLEHRPRKRIRIPRPRLRLRRPSTDTSADILVLTGLASITAACGWIYPPAAPFTGGIFLLALGLTLAGPDGEQPATRIVERWYADDDGDEDD